jgi:septal ring factor EnvC (AmiA/AmiB activator)
MKLFFFILSLLTFFSITSLGQSLKELEQRKNKTEQEIEYTSKLLSQTEQKRIQSLNQLNVLKTQIKLRKKLIGDLEQRIQLLEIEINNKSLLISSLNNDLNNLRKEYAKLIRFAWTNKSDMDILVFIFASDDFNQAYRRLRFYQQFIKFREKQGKEILNTQKLIEDEIQELSEARKDLQTSISSKSSEVANLNSEEGRYSKSVVQLKSKEKQLRKEIEERKRSMEALNKAIADLIAEEARKAAESKVDNVRDARYLRLSDGFSGNKGKLPWPTNPGVIVSDFGEHDHPVLKGVKIRNNGIDISTNANTPVKSIYEGEVKKIVSIPGSNVAVIIRHGDFLTVYSNLVKVSVKVGDNVKAMQTIGEAYEDTDTGRGIFNLQIWLENKIQNPVHWILP